MVKVYACFSLFLILATGVGLGSCDEADGNPETNMLTYMDVKITIIVGSKTFVLSLLDNATASAFLASLPLTVTMEDVNRNEKYYRLPQPLPVAAAHPGTIQSGDLNLYGSDGLVLFYKTFPTSYAYTRIGTVDQPLGLEKVLGTGTVTVTFERMEENINTNE